MPNVRAIADLAHAYGALVVVDAGAALPHMPIDMDALGADLLTVVGGDVRRPDRRRDGRRARTCWTGSTRIRGCPSPQRFEFGPLPVELLDGLTAAIDHLAGLDEWASGTRRERLVASLTAAGAYEQRLYERLDDGLRSIRDVTVLGTATDRLPDGGVHRRGLHARRRSANSCSAAASRCGPGQPASPSLLAAFGADEFGGAAFVGLMPHTATHEVDLLPGRARPTLTGLTSRATAAAAQDAQQHLADVLARFDAGGAPRQRRPGSGPGR